MALDDDFVPPEQFDEYRLIRALGRGGMGQVFLCHDTKLDRRVAVKFIRGLEVHPEARQRFETEARAIARLEAHNNVVAVYRLGDYAGHPYIVYQYIAGQSLDSLPKPISYQEALRIAIGLSRGLCAAHKQRVLHRDIKPGKGGSQGEASASDPPRGQIRTIPGSCAERYLAHTKQMISFARTLLGLSIGRDP